MSRLSTGPAVAIKDGIFGATMSAGPAHAVRDGIFGAVMATGPGVAFNDGSLGSYYAYPTSGLGSSCGCGVGADDVAVQGQLSSKLMLGAALGAIALYFLQSRGIVKPPKAIAA